MNERSENTPARQWQAMPPRVQDALIATVTFAGCALLIVAGLGPVTGTDEPHIWVRMLLAAALCGLQTQRRTRPVLALTLALVPLTADVWLGASLPALLVLTDLVYAATLYSGAAGARLLPRCVLGTAVVIVVVTGFVTQDLRYTVFAALVAAGFGISPMLTGFVVRQHRDSAAWQRERAAADRRVADLHHRSAINAERTAMARELHDVISGHLSAIALQTEALLRHERSGSEPGAGRGPVLESVRGQSVQALAAMRSMIDMLRREDADTAGGDLSELPVSLSGGLKELRRMVRTTGAQLRLSLRPDPLPELPAAVELAAYRVLAEALGNAVKHAPGSDVDVSITAGPSGLTVRVSNDLTPDSGPTGPALPNHGQGLANMLHRVTSVGGRFSAGPDTDGENRWIVEARFTLSAKPTATVASAAGR